jgi:hypothetical protein
VSEFQSELAYFTLVSDPEDKWSNPEAILGPTGAASAWSPSTHLYLTEPKMPLPGGRPVLPTIIINSMELDVKWRRTSNAQAGGVVYLQDFDIGGGSIPDDLSRNADADYAIDTLAGDLTYWNVTQGAMKDFINGDANLDFLKRNVAVNGSANASIEWIKCTIQYTYTGSGVTFPIRF